MDAAAEPLHAPALLYSLSCAIGAYGFPKFNPPLYQKLVDDWKRVPLPPLMQRLMVTDRIAYRLQHTHGTYEAEDGKERRMAVTRVDVKDDKLTLHFVDASRVRGYCEFTLAQILDPQHSQLTVPVKGGGHLRVHNLWENKPLEALRERYTELVTYMFNRLSDPQKTIDDNTYANWLDYYHAFDSPRTHPGRLANLHVALAARMKHFNGRHFFINGQRFVFQNAYYNHELKSSDRMLTFAGTPDYDFDHFTRALAPYKCGTYPIVLSFTKEETKEHAEVGVSLLDMHHRLRRDTDVGPLSTANVLEMFTDASRYLAEGVARDAQGRFLNPNSSLARVQSSALYDPKIHSITAGLLGSLNTHQLHRRDEKLRKGVLNSEAMYAKQ